MQNRITLYNIEETQYRGNPLGNDSRVSTALYAHTAINDKGHVQPHIDDCGNNQEIQRRFGISQRAQEGRQPQREAIQKAVFAGLDALKVENGASHTEFKLEGESVRIIEIGARMGGDCIGSDLVELSTGYDFVRMVIDVAAGREPSFEKVREPKTAYIHFIFTKKDLELLEKLKREIPEKIHFISELTEVREGTVTDSSTRFGYFILAFESLTEAKEYVTL